MTLVQQIGSERNLQEAWIKAQYFAVNNAPYFDVTEYYEYSRYIKENLLILREELLSGSYKPNAFRQIVVNKPTGEKRKLFFTSAKDCLAMIAILNVVGPMYERQMYEGSYGYRLAFAEEENKSLFKKWQEGYKTYIKRARLFLSFPSSAHYFITDIRNFYPSVRKEILLEKLSNQIDSNTYQLIEAIIYTESINAAEQLEVVSGVPTGTAIAPFLANVYLTELDRVMESMTIDYIRYVDDIIFACENQASIETLIETLLERLQELGLELNAAKTPEQSISIQEPRILLDHTRKMHYDQRFETTRDITVEEKKEANQIFSEIFLAVESDGDIRNIAGSSAALVVRFFERNELESLQNITLKLLEVGIVKPETLRIVMGTQMRIAHKHGINFRFRDFLLKCQDAEKITFLRLLPEFKEILEIEPISAILQEWTKNEDYLIRASVYNTIYQLQLSYHFPNLHQDFENEHSEYVRSRILYCLGNRTFDANQTIISEDFRFDVLSIVFALFWTIEGSWTGNPDMHDRYVDVLVQIASRRPGTEVIAWCQRLLLEKNRQEWRQVYELIPANIQNLLLECTLSQIEIGQVSSLIVSSIESEFGNEPALNSSQVLPSEGSVADTIERLTILDVDIPQFGYECSRRNYGHLSDHPEYICQIIECPDGRRATIEYIHINRILSVNAFPTLEHWWNYLDRLQNKGIVNILSKGEYSETVVFCVYEIPLELRTLFDVIQNEDANQDQLDPFRITRSIIQAMEITENEGFRFDGIVPQNVILTASNTPCKLLNLGFGLRPPNHNCAQPHCRYYQRKWELGRTTGLHFTGLSILELLLNTCPMEELQKIRSESEPDTTLANLLGTLDIGPHMRSVLGRLLQDEPNWRYQTTTALLKDLHHVADYRRNLASLEDGFSPDQCDQFTLVDYILFRFAIALRMPQISDDSSTTLEKTIFIVNNLSKHIKYLDEKYKAIFRQAVDRTTYWQMRGMGIPLRRMSPEARYLLRISKAWVDLINEVRQLIAVPIYPLDRLLAFNAMYIELSTYTQAVALKNHQGTELADLSWCGDLDPNLNWEVVFRLGKQNTTIRTVYSADALKEALQITRYVEDGSQSLLKPVTTISSLTAFLILNRLMFLDKSIPTQDTLEIVTQSEVSFEKFTSVVNKAGSFESAVATCIENKHTNTLLGEVDWKNISDFVHALPKIVPINRKSGMLIDYDALQEQGVVRMRIFPNVRKRRLSEDLGFQSPRVLTWGNMTKLGKKHRHVGIDLIKANGGYYVTSILSRPSLFIDALPISHGSFFIFLLRLRKYSNQTRIGVWMVFLVLLLIAVLSQDEHPFYVVIPAIWEPLHGLIDIILLPEKSQDV